MKKKISRKAKKLEGKFWKPEENNFRKFLEIMLELKEEEMKRRQVKIEIEEMKIVIQSLREDAEISIEYICTFDEKMKNFQGR